MKPEQPGCEAVQRMRTRILGVKEERAILVFVNFVTWL